VKALTTKSEVKRYGDLNFMTEAVSNFISDIETPSPSPSSLFEKLFNKAKGKYDKTKKTVLGTE
jgi:hypothetical protein